MTFALAMTRRSLVLPASLKRSQGFFLVSLLLAMCYKYRMVLSSRMTLLVVEDNAEWRAIIANGLQPICELVGFVERGDEILKAAEKFRPELVTLDIALPGGSGLNALPRLRALLPETIVVVISMSAAQIYKDEAFARGADAYIEKGSVLSSLVEAVSSARERRRKPPADHFRPLSMDAIGTN